VACVLIFAIGALAVTPGAVEAQNGDRYIVRIRSGLDGLKAIQGVCRLLGCSVLGSLDTPPEDGALQPSSLFLVRLPSLLGLDDLLSFVTRLLGVVSAEPDLPLQLAASPEVDQASAAVLDYLWRRTPVEYHGSTVWEGYLVQPAAAIVRLRDAQCRLGATGRGVIVAVIDTGVDISHPVLQPFLVRGYDFTRNVAGGDEKADLGQASAAVLDGTDACRVNQASAAVLDQASAAVLDDPEHVAFGHGTMVAGVVHLVAPEARIMPLKAFRADGTGYTSDVIRAVYHATRQGAKVINMSFSQGTSSPELQRALGYAFLRGRIPVSSAGNDGRRVLRFPAAYDTVMGVGSTSDEDVRSPFSNYGNRLVWVAAPGEGIITTYPYGTFAATWGTSFSTPFVSGAAALVAGARGATTYTDASWAVAHAEQVSGELGYGRLDLYQTLRSAASSWWLRLGPGTSSSGLCEAE
jgi:subtilisin family serine protease